MAGPKLRLLFEGELVAEVPFLGAPIRIGRLKGNEVVINNLSTSRFHATLVEQGGGFVLEDLGSENGSWVNGRRVTTCRVGPGDRIQIGKHDLVIVPAEGPVAAARPEVVSELVESAPELTDPLPALAPLESGAELGAPDEAIEALPSADLGDLAQFDVSETDLRDPDADEPLAIEPPATLLPAPGDGDATQIRPRVAVAPEPAIEPIEAAPVPEPDAERLHAGIILQRDGRLESVIQWELERMTLGRAAECEIVLATPEISRRHALLVRVGDRYEVRDLESINGTHVNGEKVTRRELQSGDVIRIEDFEMTFVIDRSPISAHVKTEAPPTAEAGGADPGMTQFGEMMDLAPFLAEESPEGDANAMSFDNLGAPLEDDDLAPIPMPGAPPAAPLAAEPAALTPVDADAVDAAGAADAADDLEMPEGLDLPEALSMPDTLEPTELLDDAAPLAAPVSEPEPDTVLLSDDDVADEEKDLVDAPREARVLRLELRIRMDELPPALREALSALDPADLRLPVELRLATED